MKQDGRIHYNKNTFTMTAEHGASIGNTANTQIKQIFSQIAATRPVSESQNQFIPDFDIIS